MRYDRVDDERALGEAAEIVATAFATSAADARGWLERSGQSELRRLVEPGERTAASLLRVPMGLWLGGQRLTNLGLAGVGVRPELRGGGLGRSLLTEALREAHAEGFLVSTLYASTQAFYRSLGYELAGAHYEARVPLAALPRARPPVQLRTYEAADRPEVVALGDRAARLHNGTLARGPYVWSRVFEVRGEPARGVLAFEGEALVGYLFYLQKTRPDAERFDLHLTDFVATSRASAERLFGFLAEHRSTGHEVKWKTGPADPLVHLLPDRDLRLSLVEYWMLRVLDAPRALEARGYPGGLEAQLELELDDPLLPDNAGRFVLEVSGGAGRVRRGGAGELQLSVRALAPLLTGHQSPRGLALWAGLRGSETALRSAEAIFAGPAPFMYDFF